MLNRLMKFMQGCARRASALASAMVIFAACLASAADAPADVDFPASVDVSADSLQVESEPSATIDVSADTLQVESEPSAVVEDSAELSPTDNVVVPPPAPAPAAAAAPQAAKQFVVRSSPILTESELERRAARLKREGYHPVRRAETAANGDIFHTLELGTFSDVTLAADLLMRIRDIDEDFFVVGTKHTRDTAGGLLDDMEQIFPGAGAIRASATVVSTAAAEDSLNLLLAQAAGPKTGSVTVKTSESGMERLIVRRQIKSSDMGTAADGAATPSQPTIARRGPTATAADGSISRTGAPPAAIEGRHSRPPVAEPLSEILRKIAWAMRAEGLSVYLEDESFKGPEGVLVGMFDRQSEAEELGGELQSYGYAVNIIMETGMKDMYYVYADPEAAATDIMLVTPDATDAYRASDAFAPPRDPGVDALIMMSNP